MPSDLLTPTAQDTPSPLMEVVRFGGGGGAGTVVSVE